MGGRRGEGIVCVQGHSCLSWVGGGEDGRWVGGREGGEDGCMKGEGKRG